MESDMPTRETIRETTRPVDAPRTRRIPKLPRSARDVLLVLHIGLSVGWLGVTVATLSLAVTGLVADSGDLRRSAYLTLGHFGNLFVLWAAVLAVLTGVLLGVGTRWGLLLHWWVATKLTLTLTVLVVGTVFANNRFQAAADAARGLAPDQVTAAAIGEPSFQVVAACVAEVVVLSVVLVLSQYKPWGRTGRGRRVLAAQTAAGRVQRSA
jgi:hypothetical protein